MSKFVEGRASKRFESAVKFIAPRSRAIIRDEKGVRKEGYIEGKIIEVPILSLIHI